MHVNERWSRHPSTVVDAAAAAAYLSWRVRVRTRDHPLAPTANPSPTLEILWQEDVAALVFERAPDGTIGDAGLTLGAPAFGDLDHLGKGAVARKIGLAELLTIEPHLPELPLGWPRPASCSRPSSSHGGR